MNQRITKAGDVFRCNGLSYVAQVVELDDLCSGCAFRYKHNDCTAAPSCSTKTESGWVSFVFKPVPQSNGEGDL